MFSKYTVRFPKVKRLTNGVHFCDFPLLENDNIVNFNDFPAKAFHDPYEPCFTLPLSSEAT